MGHTLTLEFTKDESVRDCLRSMIEYPINVVKRPIVMIVPTGYLFKHAAPIQISTYHSYLLMRERRLERLKEKEMSK